MVEPVLLHPCHQCQLSRAQNIVASSLLKVRVSSLAAVSSEKQGQQKEEQAQRGSQISSYMVLLWPFVVTQIKNINADAGYSTAMDPDMALNYSSGPDVIMELSGSTDHPDKHGPSSSRAVRYQHGHMWQPRPWHP